MARLRRAGLELGGVAVAAEVATSEGVGYHGGSNTGVDARLELEMAMTTLSGEICRRDDGTDGWRRRRGLNAGMQRWWRRLCVQGRIAREEVLH